MDKSSTMRLADQCGDQGLCFHKPVSLIWGVFARRWQDCTTSQAVSLRPKDLCGLTTSFTSDFVGTMRTCAPNASDPMIPLVKGRYCWPAFNPSTRPLGKGSSLMGRPPVVSEGTVCNIFAMPISTLASKATWLQSSWVLSIQEKKPFYFSRDLRIQRCHWIHSNVERS